MSDKDIEQVRKPSIHDLEELLEDNNVMVRMNPDGSTTKVTWEDYKKLADCLQAMKKAEENNLKAYADLCGEKNALEQHLQSAEREIERLKQEIIATEDAKQRVFVNPNEM